MNKILFSLIALLLICYNSFSQNVGIRTTSPTNTLHVVPLSGQDPLRIDGLIEYTNEKNIFIVNPTNGVVKHMHIDSLTKLIKDSINTDNQNIDSLTLNGTTLTVHIENGSSASLDISSLTGTGTDDQNLDSLTLNGTILSGYIENGNSTNINLQPIIDSAIANSPSGSDNQNIDSIILTGNIVTVYIENGTSSNVDLSQFMELPNTATTGQVLTWNGTTWIAQNQGSGADNWGSQTVVTSGANISGNGTTASPLTVTPDGIGTDDQNIDSLTLNGTTLTTYIENGSSSNINLQPLIDTAIANTPSSSDDQNIDSVTLNGTNLTVYIENGISSNVNLKPIIDSAKGSTDNDWDINSNGTGLEANPGTNIASGNHSIAAGNVNTSSGNNSAVIGGNQNIASAFSSGIFTGQSNAVSGTYSSIISSVSSNIMSQNSSIIAGNFDTIISNNSIILGGINNYITGASSLISGGSQNIVTTQNSSIFNGTRDTISGGQYSSIIGSRFSRISNGINNVIIGGDNNKVDGDNSFVGGGRNINISGLYSASIGGQSNIVSGTNGATVGGSSLRSPGNSEVTIGSYNTLYTPIGTPWNETDRVFTVGGDFFPDRDDAFIIQNDGNTFIGSDWSLINGGGIRTTSGSRVLFINRGIAPGTLAGSNKTAIWNNAGEIQVKDEADNITTISPHNFSLIPNGASESLAWAFYSERNEKAINVDMAKMARLVEKLSGENLVYIKDIKTNEIETKNLDKTKSIESLILKNKELENKNNELEKRLLRLEELLLKK